MKATKTIGSGINGVNVHFTISDLVNMHEIVRDILMDTEAMQMEEFNPAADLARLMFKVTSGGLDLEQSRKELVNPDQDIFKTESNDKAEVFNWEDYEGKPKDSVEKQKEMIGVLISLEAQAPQFRVVKDDEEEPPIT